MIQRPVETRSISGFEVSTTKLAPTKALKLLPKIMKIFVPSWRLAAPLMRGGVEAFADVPVQAIVSAITDILATIDDATLDLLYRDLLCDTSIIVPNEHETLTSVDLNTPQMIDIAFGGMDNGLTVLIEVMVFVAEVNYKRNFSDFAARLKLKKASAPTTEATSA